MDTDIQVRQDEGGLFYGCKLTIEQLSIMLLEFLNSPKYVYCCLIEFLHFRDFYVLFPLVMVAYEIDRTALRPA